MNFDQFTSKVIEGLREHFTGFAIDFQKVNKLQGQSYEGISVMPEGSNVAVTLNLAPFYERIKEDTPFCEAMTAIEHSVSEAVHNMPRFDVHTLTHYAQMKDSLTLQMIPIAGNDELLADIPHQVVAEDMAVVYRFEIESSERGTSSILVTNNLLKSYGMNQTQLHMDAAEAAVQHRPATLRNMNDVMRDIMGDLGASLIPAEPSPMWVGTVEGGVNGACVIQYPGFLEQAAETLGGDFFILPSSIHEVLLIPDDGSMELGALEQMVRDVNEMQVAPQDRLTDSVFRYDSKARDFGKARAGYAGGNLSPHHVPA